MNQNPTSIEQSGKLRLKPRPRPTSNGMKILSTIFYTIFVSLIVGVAGLLLGSMLPIPGNIEMKIVKSGSMEPAIPTGSLVVVKPQTLYRRGDIITFGEDTKTQVPTTHRIRALNDNGTYSVKGDANEEADPNSVSSTEIIGRVIVHVPYAGFVLDFARQPIGFALLIAIPAGLVILEELLAIFRETRKWWRRKGGEGDEGGGDPQRRNDRAHLVHVRKRSMDEIFVPMRMHFSKPAISPQSYVADLVKGDAYGISALLVFCLVFTSCAFAGISGGTISYFQDIETSVNNIFQAGIWPPLNIATAPPISASSLEDASSGEVLGATDEAPQDDATSTDEGTTIPDDATRTPETPPEAGDFGTPPSDAPTETPDNTPADESPHNSTNEPISDSPPADSPPPDISTKDSIQTPDVDNVQGI